MGRITGKLEQLKFAVYCFQKGKDAGFIKRVKALEKEDNLVTIEKLQGDKKENIIYYIDMDKLDSGFFAVYNKLLTLLYFADHYGLKPVVRYGTGFSYAEQHPVNGTENPFEYYFEQPVGIGTVDIQKYQCVLKNRKENSNLANLLNERSDGYSRSEQFLSEMARISGKYIRLNQIVGKQISEETAVIRERATLGVHVRGTDFKKNYNGHPVQVGTMEYLQEAVKVFQTGKYEQIFLATDDSEAIELFKKQFGDRLFYFEDVIRSSGDDTVMHSKEMRKDHHYLLGVEVLRDMHGLAACGGLIAGLSQVSYAAQIQKKSTEKEYHDLVIINKGINYHRRENCPG